MSDESNHNRKLNAILIDSDFPKDPLSTNEILNKSDENVSEESLLNDLKSNVVNLHHLVTLLTDSLFNTINMF
ncbi:unnamed protein product [Schistosoma margrebowiei]|uniref:Uncharacterized protein n=1 Tax=Schistosoma margrebowiei TaxID=48269 RepID=A0A183MHT7_9TREM|nr:unnamed protein product [Schistosoma margrebowiei]